MGRIYQKSFFDVSSLNLRFILFQIPVRRSVNKTMVPELVVVAELVEATSRFLHNYFFSSMFVE
jgi:hypothetical protein